MSEERQGVKRKHIHNEEKDRHYKLPVEYAGKDYATTKKRKHQKHRAQSSSSSSSDSSSTSSSSSSSSSDSDSSDEDYKKRHKHNHKEKHKKKKSKRRKSKSDSGPVQLSEFMKTKHKGKREERSALSGKKIHRKLKKSEIDRKRDKSREERLKFLNATM